MANYILSSRPWATLAAALILPVLGVAAGCKYDPTTIRIDGQSTHLGAEVVIRDFTRIVFKKGEKDFQLIADYGYVFSKEEIHATPEALEEDKARKAALKAQKKAEKQAKKKGKKKGLKKKQSVKVKKKKKGKKYKGKKKRKRIKKPANLPAHMKDYSFVYDEDPDFEAEKLGNLLQTNEKQFDLRGLTIIINVDLDQYKKGTWSTNIKADYGYIDAQNNLHLEGNVRVVTKEGRRLFSEYINYNREIDKIHTMAFVRVEAEDGILEGVGMVANADLNWLQILGPSGLADKQGDF